MRIKPGFVLRDLCGEHLIVAEGIEHIDFSKVVTLNDSAAVLWNAAMGTDFTPESLSQALLDEYEIDAATALSDTRRIVSLWSEAGIVE
ncbi:MAG: PqqD family protein [Bacteroidaceae bacterium]|nr:PqqD family protein [Bacteroidaceae bacterium]